MPNTVCSKLKTKNIDLEGRSRRNNIRIIGLPESIEGPRSTTIFSEVLMEIFRGPSAANPAIVRLGPPLPRC